MTLNPFKPMNLKSRILFSLTQLAVFAAIYIISSLTVLKDVYVPGWTSQYLYAYVWAVVIVLTLLKKPIIAAAITIGNALGIPIGQILGDIIEKAQTDKITPDMGYVEINNYGWFIWFCTILALAIVGIIISGRSFDKAFLNLNPFNPMNLESRLLFLLAQLAVFFATYSVYFAIDTGDSGMAFGRFLYIVPIAFMLTLIKLPTISAALTIGNILGLFIGDMLGEFMLITWLGAELLFLVAGICITVSAGVKWRRRKV
ncbi:hypothetical protein FACS1894217_15500 [Clostridia bacterium]|nr:hypothetical protein FACS1894217_15500 [Clostridia bacterium]